MLKVAALGISAGASLTLAFVAGALVGAGFMGAVALDWRDKKTFRDVLAEKIAKDLGAQLVDGPLPGVFGIRMPTKHGRN